MLELLATALLPLAGTADPAVAEPAAAASAAVTSTAVATPAPPSERLLRAVPAEPMAFAALWDVDGLRARGQDSAWYRFYQDRQVQDLETAILDLVQKGMAEEGQPLPFELEDICSALHGSMVGFVELEPREEGGEPRVLVGALFEPGEQRAGLEGLFDTVRSLAQEELGSSEEVYGDADLTRMEMDGGDGRLVWIDHPELLGVLLANEAEFGIGGAHGILDRFAGEDTSPGFSASATLREARRTNRGPADFEAFFDASTLIDLLMIEEKPSEKAMKVLDDVGVTGLRWAYGSFALGKGEAFDSNFAVYLPPSSLLGQLHEVMGPAPLRMLELMPEGSEQVSLSSFDVHRLYEIGLGALKRHDEEAHEQVSGMIQMVGAMQGIDIEQDLLAQFSGDFGSFVVPGSEHLAPDTWNDMMMMGVAPGGALLMGLEDTDEFELFLDEMLTNFQLDQMMETEDFLGVDIRVFDLGGPAAYLAFTDEALIYASSPEPIRAAIRVSVQEDATSAIGDPAFTEVLRAHPRSSSVGIMDTAALIEMYLGMMSELGEMMGMAGMTGDENPFTYLPWPDAALARKYFDGRLVSVVEVTSDALRSVTYSDSK